MKTGALLLAVAASLLASCLGPGDFRCTRHDQCAQAGVTGFCEASGRCSVADGACESGRRYVARAGETLGGQCVGDACPGDPIAALRIGAAHACVLRQGGTVWCWGDNSEGQLGDRTTTPRSTAVKVADLTGVKAIALGERHSCAARDDGTLWCWGANADGQLGDGSPRRTSPALVAGVANVTDVAAGASATCALTRDGFVSCWGANEHGQLGDGSGASHTSPVQVFALTGVRKIASHWDHVCALRDDETLWCWGNDGSGQLGDGGTADQPRPVRVSGLAAVTDFAVGLAHTCASTHVDGLWCWGDGGSGQLGQGDAAAQPRPVQVTSISDPISIAAGLQHTCAVRRSGGGAWCWGNNRYGQLGEGTTGNFDVPSPVTDLTHVVEVAAGERFSCGRRDDGTVWCWGDNHAGQLGTGSAVIRETPFLVDAGNGTVGVAAGGAHTCAIVAPLPGESTVGPPTATTGNVVCWGADLAGQLGDNSTADRAAPGPTKPPLHARAVAGGGAHTCARAEDADLLTDAGVWCWGRGSSGQVGPRSLVDTPVPVVALPPEMTHTSAVASGDAHSCALGQGDGAVWCWGSNRDGQLGDGTAVDHATPAKIAGLAGARGLAAGGGHTCALGGNGDDGAVWCWGRGTAGQLGDGGALSQATPVRAMLTGGGGGAPLSATAVAAGEDHTCALDDGGGVWCWGRGDDGQLGGGQMIASAPPAPVVLPAAATAIAAGAAHTCALAADGIVWCWGANDQGQLGVGPAGTDAATPVQALTGADRITTGARHTCARRTDGTIWCWGSNSAGQLGDGVALQRNVPQLDRLACTH